MSDVLPRGFLADIVANIDEDTPRLVYADWLQENGRDTRAEFIRVQIERARLPAWDPAQVRLALREQALLKVHGEEWLKELPVVQGARWEGFRRGIVAEVSFASFEAMRTHAHECRAAAPVEAVTVRWPRRRETGATTDPIAELRELSLTGRPANEDEIRWLADSPQLATLRVLTARGLWVEGLQRLVASPHLSKLKMFRLPSNNLGSTGIQALTRSSLTSLEELELTGQLYENYGEDPTVQAIGVRALAGWPGLAGMRSLKLTGSSTGREGLRALVRSPHAAALKELALRAAGLDGQALGELDSAVKGLQLESLDLGENVLKDVGAEYIALAPCLRGLRAIRLGRCEIRQNGARLLAKKAPFLDGLRVLDVGFNHFGPVGLDALLARIPALHTLRMGDNDLSNEAVERLASAPASDTLLELDLSNNRLGPDAVQALGAASHLRELLVLRLLGNPITEPNAKALSNSPLGKRLAVLELDNLPGAPGVGDPIPF